MTPIGLRFHWKTFIEHKSGRFLSPESREPAQQRSYLHSYPDMSGRFRFPSAMIAAWDHFIIAPYSTALRGVDRHADSRTRRSVHYNSGDQERGQLSSDLGRPSVSRVRIRRRRRRGVTLIELTLGKPSTTRARRDFPQGRSVLPLLFAETVESIAGSARAVRPCLPRPSLVASSAEST